MKLSVIKLMVKDPYLQMGTLLVVLGTTMVYLGGTWWWWLLLVPYPVFPVLYYQRCKGMVR